MTEDWRKIEKALEWNGFVFFVYVLFSENDARRSNQVKNAFDVYISLYLVITVIETILADSKGNNE